MQANLENLAVTTGLEKVSFQSNPKKRQCRRMFKLPHNCTHLTCQQSNAQEDSTICEPRTSRCSSWILKRQRNPEIKLPISIGSQKNQDSFRKTPTSASLTKPKPLTTWITTNCGKFLKEIEYHHFTCLQNNLYIGQEATVRTRHGTKD